MALLKNNIDLEKGIRDDLLPPAIKPGLGSPADDDGTNRIGVKNARKNAKVIALVFLICTFLLAGLIAFSFNGEAGIASGAAEEKNQDDPHGKSGSTSSIDSDVDAILASMNMEWSDPEKGTLYQATSRGRMVDLSLFNPTKEMLRAKDNVLRKFLETGKYPTYDRAAGSMVGMVLGDAFGKPYEFEPCRDVKVSQEDNEVTVTAVTANEVKAPISLPKNAWSVKEDTELPFGQWYHQGHTNRFSYSDDASMGICLADSLLLSSAHAGKFAPAGQSSSDDDVSEYDGRLQRAFYVQWWNSGLNNGGLEGSVGLGGNIRKSVNNAKRNMKRITNRYNADTEDAGNGSVMRLTPVAIRFAKTLRYAVRIGWEQSLTTHPGAVAAAASHFWTFMISKAIYRDPGSNDSIKTWMEKQAKTYLAVYGDLMDGVDRRIRGLISGDRTELEDWNWKAENSRSTVRQFIDARLKNGTYNGYPVSRGYAGSFSLDAIYVALFSVYNSRDFGSAIRISVSMLGDCDSHGSVTGQLAGAYYGYQSIPTEWRDGLKYWGERATKDISTWTKPPHDRELELRAVLLHHLNQNETTADLLNATWKGEKLGALPKRWQSPRFTFSDEKVDDQEFASHSGSPGTGHDAFSNRLGFHPRDSEDSEEGLKKPDANHPGEAEDSNGHKAQKKGPENIELEESDDMSQLIRSANCPCGWLCSWLGLSNACSEKK